MKRKILLWLLVIFGMALIFYLSHQPANKSNGLSKGATEIIVETLEKAAPNIVINKSEFNHILRKNAHFFAYLVLGILVANGLKNCGIIGYKAIGLAIFICVLYAISDEIHQLFVPGRGGQVKDVLIDGAGAVVGILGYNGFIKRRL